MKIDLGVWNLPVASRGVPTADGRGTSYQREVGEVELALEINAEELARLLGPRASMSKGKKAKLGGGAILVRAKVVKHTGVWK